MAYRPSASERGAALIMALLVLALLVTVILEFDTRVRQELREAAMFRDTLKAATLARAGIQAARAMLQDDALHDRQTPTPMDTLTELWAKPIVNFPLGDGLLSGQLQDEQAKFNLNQLSVPEEPVRSEKLDQVKRLFEVLTVDPRLAEAIADWIDTDEKAEPNGAETAYYQTLKPPYRAANAPLQTLDELRLVKGMTGESLARILPYVTIYPKGAEGGGVNMNTAALPVLQVLHTEMTPAMAQEIIQGRPFSTPQDLDQVTSFEPVAKKLRTFNASAYHVLSEYVSIPLTAVVNDVSKQAYAVIYRSRVNGETKVLYFQLE